MAVYLCDNSDTNVPFSSLRRAHQQKGAEQGCPGATWGMRLAGNIPEPAKSIPATWGVLAHRSKAAWCQSQWHPWTSGVSVFTQPGESRWIVQKIKITHTSEKRQAEEGEGFWSHWYQCEHKTQDHSTNRPPPGAHLDHLPHKLSQWNSQRLLQSVDG